MNGRGSNNRNPIPKSRRSHPSACIPQRPNFSQDNPTAWLYRLQTRFEALSSACSEVATGFEHLRAAIDDMQGAHPPNLANLADHILGSQIVPPPQHSFPPPPKSPQPLPIRFVSPLTHPVADKTPYSVTPPPPASFVNQPPDSTTPPPPPPSIVGQPPDNTTLPQRPYIINQLPDSATPPPPSAVNQPPDSTTPTLPLVYHQTSENSAGDSPRTSSTRDDAIEPPRKKIKVEQLEMPSARSPATSELSPTKSSRSPEKSDDTNATQHTDVATWSESARRRLTNDFIQYFERRREVALDSELITPKFVADEIIELCFEPPAITRVDKQVGRYLSRHTVPKDPIVLAAIRDWIDIEKRDRGELPSVGKSNW